MMRAFGDSAKKFGREVMRLNARLGAYDNQALDEIAQFPDISGPGIANKNFRGGVAELAHFLSIRGAEFSQEKSRQRRSEEHTSELQSHSDLVCRLLLEKKKKKK